MGDAGNLYRIAGDEFVCIYHNPETQYILRCIEENSWSGFSEELPFQGVSLGAVSYTHLLKIDRQGGKSYEFSRHRRGVREQADCSGDF